MAARPPVRIALNIAIDGALAAVAVPLARVVADPSGDWLHPPGFLLRVRRHCCWRDCHSGCHGNSGDLPGSTICSGWSGPARLAPPCSRFVLALTGVSSGNPAFPVVYALTLLVLLGAPRVVYRRWRHRRGAPRAGYAPDIPTALVVGATEDIDLFLRALAWDRHGDPAGRGPAGSRLTADRTAHPWLPVPWLDRGYRHSAGTPGQ